MSCVYLLRKAAVSGLIRSIVYALSLGTTIN